MEDDDTVTLAKQGGITFVGRIVDLALGFLFLAIVTRIVDSSVYGEFTLALSVVLILQRFDLNIDSAIDYFLPEQLDNEDYNRAKSTFYNALVLNVLSIVGVSVLLYFAAPLIAAQFDTKGLTGTLRSLIPILPLLSLSRIFYKYFNVIKQTQYRVYAQNIVRPVVKIVVLVVLAGLGFEMLSLTMAYIVAYLLAFVLCLVFFFPRSRQLRAAKFTEISRANILRYTLPLLFAGVMWTVIGQIDYFVIGLFGSSDDVAHYRVGYQLAANLVIVSNIFNPVFKPMVAERQSESERLQSVYRLATRWISMMLLPLCIVLVLAPEPYLAVLFTEEYTVAALAVTVLALGYLFSSSVGPEAMVLSGLGYSRLIFFNTALMLAINIVLDVILVPRLGITGAAIGTAAALSVRSIAGVVEIFGLERVYPYSMTYARIWIGGAIAAGIGLGVTLISVSRVLTFVLLPTIVGISYIAALASVGAFTDDDELIASRLDRRIGYPVFEKILVLGKQSR